MKRDIYEKTRTMVVTIDGPCASGKSTIAKKIAERLHFQHIDTGAIYRTIALWAFRNCGTEENKNLWLPCLNSIKYEFIVQGREVLHKLNDEIVNDKIRTPQISQLSSRLAVIPEVREVATRFQREIAKGCDVVVEGRDAGTVVFPSAPVKIYLTAQSHERAKRRLEELRRCSKGECGTFEETLKEIQERDERDEKRAVSPMKKPVDAVTIDTTGMTIDQVVNEVIRIVKQRRPRKPSWLSQKLMGKERAHTSFAYKAVFLFMKAIYKLFYRIKIYGVENYPINDVCATIVAPNHVSFLDPPAIGLACPVELHSLGIDYLFKPRILRWLLPKINVHPVSGKLTDTKVIRTVVSLLKEGKDILIFPEGQRSPTGKLLPLKRGVSVLAALTGCSITPTYIGGAYEIWPRNKRFPKLWGKITVTFGKPLYFEEYARAYPSRKEAEGAILADLEKALKQLASTL